MSIKYFCDQCDVEITDQNTCGGRLTSRWNKLQFEVMVGPTQGAWNAGNWCKYCIIDAVQSCDDRPTAVGETK